MQQIVDSLPPDVPVQRRRKAPETGFELLVVDRHAFALELARVGALGPAAFPGALTPPNVSLLFRRDHTL